MAQLLREVELGFYARMDARSTGEPAQRQHGGRPELGQLIANMCNAELR